MANWKQELQQEIAGIDDVDRNDAVLTLRIDTLGGFYGGSGGIIEIRRKLIVKAPRPVNVRLVDGLNYLAGDFLCRAAFLRVRAALEPQPDDPEITIGGEIRTFAEARPFTASDNWGIRIGGDMLAVGGDAWAIAGIKSLQHLDGEPALLEFTLRK